MKYHNCTVFGTSKHYRVFFKVQGFDYDEIGGHRESWGVVGGYFIMILSFFCMLNNGGLGVMGEIEEAGRCYQLQQQKCPENECIDKIWVIVYPEGKVDVFSPKGKVRTIHYFYSCQNYQILLTGGIGLRTTLLAITASRP